MNAIQPTVQVIVPTSSLGGHLENGRLWLGPPPPPQKKISDE